MKIRSNLLNSLFQQYLKLKEMYPIRKALLMYILVVTLLTASDAGTILGHGGTRPRAPKSGTFFAKNGVFAGIGVFFDPKKRSLKKRFSPD